MNRGCGCLVAGIMVLVSVALLFVAVAWGGRSYTVSRTWIPVQGEVVSLVSSQDSDGSTTYAPVVEYHTGSELPRRFQHTVSSGGLLANEIGDRVAVLYDPDDPDHAIIRSTMGLWLGPILFGAFGAIASIATILGIWGVRRAGSRANPPKPDRPATVGRQHNPVEFRRVESSIDDAGVFRYRIVARGEDGAEHVGDWLPEDPTMRLMADGYQVRLERRGDRWIVVES